MAGHDARDSTSVAEPVPDYAAALGRPVKGLRIGIINEFFGEGLATLFAEFVETAVSLLGEVQLPAGGDVNVEGDILRQS